MTATARATEQSETFHFDRERSPGVTITLPAIPVDGDRNQYLREGIAAMIRRARRYMRAKDGENTHWSEGYAGRIIEWALSLKEEGLVQAAASDDEAPIDHPVTSQNPGNLFQSYADTDADRVIEDSASAHSGSLNQTLLSPPADQRDYWIYADDDAVQLTRDPIVRFLVEGHRERRAFPAKHPFSMTNPIEDGRILMLATCKCGHVVKFGAGDQLRVDAAIEAHWRRFDFEPKVDGRGQKIIPGDGSRIPTAKKSRKKKQPDATGPLQERDIAYENPTHWVLRKPAGGFEVYRNGVTHSTRCAQIGFEGDKGLQRAIAEADKRHATTLPKSDAPGQPASLASAPDSTGINGADAPSSDIADACPNAPRSEPAPHAPPGAGSPLLEAAPIGAGSLASDMAAEPQDDWSELLRAATDLAWREPLPITETQKALLDFSKVYMPGEVTRPTLRWHGGKWKLAPWIIQHFPPHRIYCEPFGGAGSVLLRKKSALSEIYNDLDTEVVNLFRVLRSADAARLIELLRLTPFARGEFDEAFEFIDDCVERARRLIVRSFFAGGSRGVLDVDRTMAGFNGGGARSRGDNPNSSHSRDWSNYADTLPAAVARLTSVVIENRPAVELMKQHDSEETLFYVDPPYLADTRSDRARKAYRFELNDDEHRELLDFLKALDGMVILSGYASQIYDDALPGWRRVEREAMADGAQPRVEILWINPHCAAALDEQHPALFDLAAHDVANTPPPPRRQQASGG